MSNLVRILQAPIERGELALPETGKILVLGALSLSDSVLHDMGGRLICVQSDRGEFLSLEREGLTVTPTLPELAEPPSAAIVLAGKHRNVNEANIATASKLVGTGGLVVVAGEKTSGIASLRKMVAAETKISGSMAKHHGNCFWFEATETAFNWPLETSTIELANGAMANTVAGMFSSKAIDPGSALLVEFFASRFAQKIAGRVADFGCGWGYLGMELLGHCPKIERLSSFEVDYHSLQATKSNLEQLKKEVELCFHWFDFKSEPVERDYDWVIMNPPFHDGRNSNIDLGHAFIEAAGRALRPHGKMLMVANAHLRYESKLEAVFPKFELLDQRHGFKIIMAWR